MLLVKVAQGLKIPLEHSHKDSIPADRIVQVEETHYYKSMITDGDLLLATAEEWAVQQAADAKLEEEAIAADAKVKADAIAAAAAEEKAKAAVAKAAAKQTATN